MKHDYSARLDTIELRPMDHADIEAMRQLRNRHSKSFVYSGEITQEGQQAWFTRYLETPGDYMFSVFSQNSWIGASAIYGVNGKRAEFGRLMIDKNVTGEKGFGTVTTLCTCRIGFEQIGLSEIYLEVYTDNFAAIRTYERAGFNVIGQTADLKGRAMLNMICKNSEV